MQSIKEFLFKCKSCPYKVFDEIF